MGAGSLRVAYLPVFFWSFPRLNIANATRNDPAPRKGIEKPLPLRWVRLQDLEIDRLV